MISLEIMKNKNHTEYFTTFLGLLVDRYLLIMNVNLGETMIRNFKAFDLDVLSCFCFRFEFIIRHLAS